MNLWEMIRRWTGAVDLDEIADRIASESLPIVWNRVQHRAVELGVAEARGYIRARARPMVHQQVKETLARLRLSIDYHTTILEMSLERVVKLAIAESLEAVRRKMSQRRRAAA